MKTILLSSLSVLFLFAPAFPYIQTLNPNRQDTPEVPFHTPLYTEGKALPTHITEHLTIGPEDGIVLIHAMITVHQSGSLTIKPGTTLAVDEYAGIHVFGTIEARGTKDNPIHFLSNERNETNRNWNGILYEQTGTGTIEHAIFQYASPAVSCLVPHTVTLQNTTFRFGNLDVYGPC